VGNRFNSTGLGVRVLGRDDKASAALEYSAGSASFISGPFWSLAMARSVTSVPRVTVKSVAYRV
jgi:hypothetical protein